MRRKKNLMDFSSNYVRILRKETFLAFRRETSMLKFPQEIVDMYKDLKPAHQKIYRIIRDTIFSGQIPSGEKFTEEGIAKALCISRTPVRSALSRLRSEGLLQNITKSNLGIREYSLQEKTDLIYLDSLLEGKAAYLAAERGVSQEDLSTLIEINDAIATYRDLPPSPTQLNVCGVRDLHMQFHLLIAKFSGNRFLYKEIVELRNIMRILRSELVYSKERRNDYADFIAPTHRQLIQAIQARCPEDAEIIVRYEISHGREIYADSSIDLGRGG